MNIYIYIHTYVIKYIPISVYDYFHEIIVNYKHMQHMAYILYSCPDIFKIVKQRNQPIIAIIFFNNLEKLPQTYLFFII
jgi:hypothetical protein